MSSQPSNTKYLRNTMLYSAICSAMTISAASAAQSTADTLEMDTAVIVDQADSKFQNKNASSPKFTAPLVDTPRTVNVIPEQLIKERGATSLQDVLRTTPGVTLGSGEGGTPTGDRPFIRGYEASTDIFIDGMRDYARGSHETFNLESVEVIKGPSSAYTGRGGTGGSINLSTKKPKLDNFLEGTVGIGNGGQNRQTLDGNYMLTDSVAVRLNLMRMGGDIPGRDDVEYDRWGIAPTISFGLGTPTRVTLSYAHIENKDTPDMGIPFKNDANGRNTPIKVDRDNFYGRKKLDFNKNVFDTATVDFEHDINDAFTLRNATRYGTSLNHYLFSRPTFDNCKAGDTGSCATEDGDLQFTRGNRARYRKSESIINQTDVYGTFNTGTLEHSLTAGTEFSREEISSKTMTAKAAEGTDSFWNPNSGGRYDKSISYGPKLKDGDIKTMAYYVFDTVKLNERWSLNGGVRYDKFKVYKNETESRGKLVPSQSREDGMWNYQAGVVFKPAQNGSIYLSYGTSSNPSGENLGQAGGADGPASAAAVNDLKPEKSRSIELGTKWDVLNEKLSLTAAVFETKKTDARSYDPLTDDVSLAGENRVRGIELGATGSITDKWDIWAGYTYLDPKVKKYRVGENVYDGNQIKFIAKNSATLWTTYEPIKDWTIGGGVSYVGERYVDDENSLKLPSHTLYDAMVGYQMTRNFELQLNVNNITDTRVYDASHVGLFANVGPGRSYMLNANYSF